jgi:hypothetical protein
MNATTSKIYARFVLLQLIAASTVATLSHGQTLDLLQAHPIARQKRARKLENPKV